MNERIKELARQAFAEMQNPKSSITYEELSIVDRGRILTTYVFTDDVTSKFAELIVEECINELSEAFAMTTEEGNHLKQHFGIENK